MSHIRPLREFAAPHDRYIGSLKFGFGAALITAMLLPQANTISLDVESGFDDVPKQPSAAIVPTVSQMNTDLTAVIAHEAESLQLEVCPGVTTYRDDQQIDDPIIIRSREDMIGQGTEQQAVLGHLVGEGARISIQLINEPNAAFLANCLANQPTYVEARAYVTDAGNSGLMAYNETTGIERRDNGHPIYPGRTTPGNS